MRQGELPPGAAEQMARSIEGWKSSGHCSGVELSAGPGCEVADKHNGEIYGFDNLPDLPFRGCKRHPCCACGFLPVISTEAGEKVSAKMASWKKRLAWLVGAWAVVVAASFFLSGCASHGVMVSEQQVQQFKRGETTEAQVIAALGQPTTVSSYNGQRSLIYSGAHAQARPASFIPLIGPLVGGADVRASSVVFRVKDGVVIDIISSHTASGSGTGFASGAPIAQVPEQPRKPE